MVLSAVKSVPVVVAASAALSYCIIHLLAHHARIEVASSAWNRVLLNIGHSSEVVLKRCVYCMEIFLPDRLAVGVRAVTGAMSA